MLTQEGKVHGASTLGNVVLVCTFVMTRDVFIIRNDCIGYPYLFLHILCILKLDTFYAIGFLKYFKYLFHRVIFSW